MRETCRGDCHVTPRLPRHPSRKVTLATASSRKLPHKYTQVARNFKRCSRSRASTQFWPSLADPNNVFANAGQLRPQFDKSRPKLVGVGHCMVDVGHHRQDSERSLPTWATSLKKGHRRPMSSEDCQSLAEFGQQVVRIGRILSNRGRTSAPWRSLSAICFASRWALKGPVERAFSARHYAAERNQASRQAQRMPRSAVQGKSGDLPSAPG